MRFSAIIFFFLAFFLFFEASAAVTMSRPRPMAGNHHIKLLTYRPTGMHYYKGFYGYESSILFQEGEEFEIIAMGDPKGWQLNPVEHRLFLKPLDAGANTNATIITRVKETDERRVYLFQLHAEEAKDGMEDEELAYEVRIVHAAVRYDRGGAYYTGSLEGEEGLSGDEKMAVLPGGVPDPTNPSLNYDYTVAGDAEIRPARAFDDGRFTYLQFPKHAELPAVFIVDADGYEEILNFRSLNDYIIIETTTSLFSLRRGPLAACLFNERKPYVGKYVQKRSRGIFVKSS